MEKSLAWLIFSRNIVDGVSTFCKEYCIISGIATKGSVHAFLVGRWGVDSFLMPDVSALRVAMDVLWVSRDILGRCTALLLTNERSGRNG